MSNTSWHEGGCFCGEVRYRVRGDAVWKAGCTCESCVKIQSAPLAVWAGFDRADHEILKGKPRSFRSSPHVIRTSCPICGSTLTYEKTTDVGEQLSEAAKLVYIAVVSLDDPTLYPPDEIVFGRDKVPWLELAGSIPLHEGVSPSANHLQFEGVGRSAKNE